MKPTPRAKYSYNARTYSSVNKETVSISSLINADITLKVLYEAHGQGLEKDDRAILASTLKTTSRITNRLEKMLLTKHQKVSTTAGVPRVGAVTQKDATKCAACSKKLMMMMSRADNCFTCGYISCGKCLTQRLVPRAFGADENTTVKVCALCCNWFKEFMNTKFEEYSRPKANETADAPALHGTSRHSSLFVTHELSVDFLAQLDVAVDEEHVPSNVRHEIESALESGLTVSTAAAIMTKLKHELATVVNHYEYQDDMDSNDSDAEQPLHSHSRSSTRKLTKFDKKSGVPQAAIQSLLDLMVLLDSIQPDEDAPHALDDDDGHQLPQRPPSHTRQVSEEFDPFADATHDADDDESMPAVAFYASLFRRPTDRYRLVVCPQQGVIETTSISRGGTTSFRLFDVQVQSVVSDAVRFTFSYKPDLIYQFASEGEKIHLCTMVEAYKAAHPRPERPRLPLVPMFKGERKMHMSSFPATAVLGDNNCVRGVVMNTNYRVLFVPLEDVPMIEVPLFAIVGATRVATNGGHGRDPNSAGGRTSSMLITCKDVRTLRLDVAEDKFEILQHMIAQLSESMQRNNPVHFLTTPTEVTLDVPHFAFSYSTSQTAVDGWQFGTITRDYERMGLKNAAPFQWINNEDGNVCDSYPPTLVLPSKLTRGSILSASAFRAKNRLPVVTWIHPRNRSVLARSSQPLLGRILSGASCNMDESIIDSYRTLAGAAKPFYIFDARKSKAAAGNRLMGKGGVETSENYEGAIIFHLNISNMYKMQNAFQALTKICLVPEFDKSWWSAVEGTHWFEHLHLILDGALRIARVLDIEGASALVHCSDGWDRTCQLVCLAQMMLDPYYRTLHGFATLVEKDWCLFGHKFMERLGGNRVKDPTRAKMSPIFLQFLDAVYQMLMQFPNAFEFNERCLLHLANALSSGLYGTFVYDSYQQRKAANVHLKTVSVWTPLCASSNQFINHDYEPTDQPVWVWAGHQAIKLWTGYFFQYHENQSKLVDTSTKATSMAPDANDPNEPDDDMASSESSSTVVS
ncbi:Aste57867_11635 [Aphanomyces stellatus]|uniref:phosphatidylinositol-3,5-bisphosphate 3-phosphatase n=1 Tax=Aphanomyces stellatus TaxID=120398 RepID=A0A485KTV5_9STRA|nr:hypothetical protein As57867_011592 [Aphanomyces stellatus]VFT88493.1 Aste57867_11635 [Aphanomyces stellatus]